MLLHWVQPQNHMHIHPTKIMMGKLLDSKIYQSTQAKNCPTLITSAYKTKHDELDILLYSSQNCTKVMLVSIASTGLIWLVPNSLPSWTIGCSGLSFNLFSTNPKLDQPKSLLLLHPKTGLQQIKPNQPNLLGNLHLWWQEFHKGEGITKSQEHEALMIQLLNQKKIVPRGTASK